MLADEGIPVAPTQSYMLMITDTSYILFKIFPSLTALVLVEVSYVIVRL